MRPITIWFCKTEELHCRFTLLLHDIVTVTTWYVTIVPVSLIHDTLLSEMPVTDILYRDVLVFASLVSDTLVTVIPISDFSTVCLFKLPFYLSSIFKFEFVCPNRKKYCTQMNGIVCL